MMMKTTTFMLTAMLALSNIVMCQQINQKNPLAESRRNTLDSLAYGFVDKHVSDEEFDVDETLAFLSAYMDEHCGKMEGFTIYSDTLVTNSIHLQWEAGEVVDEAFAMDVSGRWIYQIEWPSDSVDPQKTIRKWIEQTVRNQLNATFPDSDYVAPFRGDFGAINPMMDYYADCYRDLYREQVPTDKKNNAWEGAYACYYGIELRPALVIRLRYIDEQYVTFYVADFIPGYRSVPSYYQQTLRRNNGTFVWLEDLVEEDDVEQVKKTIKERFDPFEYDSTLNEAIRNHNYRLAITESGIVLSFLPYTFSITAGSEGFQAFFNFAILKR